MQSTGMFVTRLFKERISSRAPLPLPLPLTLSVALLLGAGSGCASRNPNSAGYQFPGENGAVAGSAAPRSTNSGPVTASMLRIGDMVTVSFSDVPAPGLPEIRARIPDDGMLTLHYNVRVKAAGLIIPDLEKEIRAAFVPKMFRNLTAIVRTEDRDFYVGGEVKQPNRYPLRYGDMTVLRAIDSAGGFTEFANRSKIDLRRQDGTTVRLSEKKINRGQMVDLPVLANDHIIVRKRWW
jgi:protein involved in polysaccharide export with SLBB domain